MSSTTTLIDGIEIAYETAGSGPPVLLLTGLGGVGRSWGEHIDRFAESGHHTIVPDHRGTGASAKPADGYTIAALASDNAGLVRHLGAGPVHVVGSSTGGAIAQAMALDHADTVASITLVSSWAGPDPYFLREFRTRRSILVESGVTAYTEASALFLFSPIAAVRRPELVEAWVEKVAAKPGDPDIMAARIDMIMAHDLRDRLGSIAVPCHVVVGRDDICTPPYASEELAAAIPDAQLTVLDGGHLIYLESPDAFFDAVSGFIAEQ